MLSRLAMTLSAPVVRADHANLALQDAINAAVPWLWWPLEVPAVERPMPPGAHALYVVHAWVIARTIGLPRGPGWTVATVASWAIFTGAWDRRARLVPGARRSRP